MVCSLFFYTIGLRYYNSESGYGKGCIYELIPDSVLINSITNFF